MEEFADEIGVTALSFGKGGVRTKWQILERRRYALRLALQKLDKELTGLEGTHCGLTCSGCGEFLETEKDFASHFIVTDERYLNLGECPHR